MNYTINSFVFNDWKIVREIGEGSFGKVFEIQKTDFGITSRSALKVITVPKNQSDVRLALSEGMDERSVTSYFQGFVDELVKEIAIMSSLKSHPGIVSCEDHKVLPHSGELGWDILIRMELLTPLTEYQMNHTFDEALVRKMAMDLTSALVFCQKKALIHRDIKPENIFVNESGQFKLGDFGVARTAGKTTGGLSKKGTEIYMAPEVYLAQPYGCSVDVYSLGLVLYKFMNYGRLPFLPPYPAPITFADRENSMVQRMQGVQLPPPAAASPELAQIILTACSYHPRDRYLSAADMLAALQALPPLQSQPSAASAFFTPEDPADSDATIGIWGQKPKAAPEPSIAPSYRPSVEPSVNPSYRPQPTPQPQPGPQAQTRPQPQPTPQPQPQSQVQPAPQPQTTPPPPPAPPAPKSSSKKGLIIGLCCGAALLILGIIGGIVGTISSRSSDPYVADTYNNGYNTDDYYDTDSSDPYAVEAFIDYAQASFTGYSTSSEVNIIDPLTGEVTDVYNECLAAGYNNTYIFYYDPTAGTAREDSLLTNRGIYLGSTQDDVMEAYGTAWIHTTAYDTSHWIYETFSDMQDVLSESWSYVAYQIDTDWFMEFHLDQNDEVCYIVIFYGDYDSLVNE